MAGPAARVDGGSTWNPADALAGLERLEARVVVTETGGINVTPSTPVPGHLVEA